MLFSRLGFADRWDSSIYPGLSRRRSTTVFVSPKNINRLRDTWRQGGNTHLGFFTPVSSDKHEGEEKSENRSHRGSRDREAVDQGDASTGEQEAKIGHADSP